MAGLIMTTAVALYVALRAHLQMRTMVVPVLRIKTCSACQLPRDITAFPSASAKRCSACTPLIAPAPRACGRQRLWKAQCARVRLELRKAHVQGQRGYAAELLGCAHADELWAHLAPKLCAGMTEDNYGEWHVDHVTPVASFDLTQPEHRARCFNAANMAPLWAADNMAKAARNNTTGTHTLPRKDTPKPPPSDCDM